MKKRILVTLDEKTVSELNEIAASGIVRASQSAVAAFLIREGLRSLAKVRAENE